MYKFEVHENAEVDLDEIWIHDKATAARIEVFLEELATDSRSLTHLTEHGYGKARSAEFDVSKFLHFWNQGKDIWRLKLWDLEDLGIRYRIIYAYIPNDLTFYVLAVAHRDFGYESTDPATLRLIAAYNDLTE